MRGAAIRGVDVLPIVPGAIRSAGSTSSAGALDRVFTAYDDQTGKELWRMRLNDVPNSAPISFMAGGKQYIALHGMETLAVYALKAERR